MPTVSPGPTGTGYTYWALGGCNCPSSGLYTCGTCGVPATNLTLSWVNSIFGNSSCPLVYAGGGSWATSCQWPYPGGTIAAQSFKANLICVGSNLTFTLLVYPAAGSATCVTPSSTCSAFPGSGVHALQVTGLTCGPSFLMTIKDNSCMNADGYGPWTITP